MRKRKFLFGVLLAFLTAFTFGFKINTSSKTYAAGVVTITFDANEGECATTSMQTGDTGTLSSLPTPTRSGYIFDCWLNGSDPVTTSTVFDEDTTIIARYYQQIFSYTISKPASTYTIIGKTINSALNYTLSTTSASLEDAISLIKSDLTNETKPTSINFDNITLEKNLDLNFQNLSLSGNLNLGAFSINYTTPVSNSILNLQDLTLISTASQNQINVSGEHRVSMEISNAKFNSTQNNNNYAMFFTNDSTSIIVQNKISHETAYLYNHSTNTSAQMRDIDVSEQTTGFLAITIPYNADGSTVVSTNINSSKFKFIPLSSNYTCETIKMDHTCKWMCSLT